MCAERGRVPHDAEFVAHRDVLLFLKHLVDAGEMRVQRVYPTDRVRMFQYDVLSIR